MVDIVVGGWPRNQVSISKQINFYRGHLFSELELAHIGLQKPQWFGLVYGSVRKG